MDAGNPTGFFANLYRVIERDDVTAQIPGPTPRFSSRLPIRRYLQNL